MRSLLVICALACTAPVATAQSGTEKLPLDGPEAKQVRRLLDRLRKALRNADGDAYVAHFDFDRMKQALLTLVKPAQRPMARSPLYWMGISRGMAGQIARQASGAKWLSYELRSVRRHPDGRSLVVMARHTVLKRGNYEYFRWYVHPVDGAMRVWDVQLISQGVRTTARLAAVVPVGGRLDPRLLVALRAVGAAMTAYVRGDLAVAEAQAGKIAEGALPPSIDVQRVLILAGIRLQSDRPAEAKAILDQFPLDDVPIIQLQRALALLSLGRPAEAEPLARWVVDRLVDEPTALNALGGALLHTGRASESITCFRRANDQDPSAPDNVLGLALALPLDQFDDVLRRFTKLTDLVSGMDHIGSSLLESEMPAKILALVPRARELTGNHPIADFFEGLAYELQGDVGKALPLLEKAMRRAPEGDAGYAYRYMLVALEAGKALEAYGNVPDPRVALETIAWALDERGAWKPLSAVIAEHRKRLPGDIWLHYFDGRLATASGQVDAAVKHFGAGWRAATDAETKETFRARLVIAHCESGTWREAYESIPPVIDTFGSIANWLDDRRDGKTLEILCGLFAKTHPADGSLPLWRADARAHQGDHAGAIALLEPLQTRYIQDAARLAWFEQRWILSLVTLRRFDDAMTAARASTARDDDPWYELVVVCAQGKVTAARRRMRRLVKLGYDPSRFWADPIVATALRTDAFARVREEFPERN